MAECLIKMSKGEILRGFVNERLAAATREIIAVVDRIVAGYEEEASGFREEIDRQRRQLELLQAQVTPDKAGVKSSKSLGPVEEEEEEEAESPERPGNLQDSTSQTASSSFSPRLRYQKRKPGRRQTSETQNNVVLRVRILEDCRTDVLSNIILKRCPMRRLTCPGGLQEADFLDLLRSTFPQLSGDDKLFDVLKSDERRRLLPLTVRTLTPEEIHRNISRTRSKSTLYIRLKGSRAGEDDSRPPQTKDTEDSLSTAAMVTCDETRLQTSVPVQEVEGSGVDVMSVSSTSQKQDMETEEADHEERGISEPAESKDHDSDDGEREEANDRDDDWKPDKSDVKLKESDSKQRPKTTKKQKARRSGVKSTKSKTENSDDVFSCKVCGALHKSEVTFVKHAWTHMDDAGSLCGVCGELSESAEALKDHLQSYHKTDDCGESFLSLDEHVAAHSRETPYECDVCHDVFALSLSLENHRKLHEAGTPYKCYTCHKVFAKKEHLKAHCVTHTNKKKQLCGVCGKSLSDYRSLSRHKLTHSGERPHSCRVCGSRFKLPGTLRQHEKIHTDRERSYLCDVCCKMFMTSKQLQIHMRMHTNEKPYHCGECGRGFSTKGPLTVHMRIHTGETPYSCPDCGWAFKRKVNLDNHVTVHSGLKPFVCVTCGKACARKAYLKVHMRTHNGERPYKCKLCDKAFTQSHCLKTHMKSHLVANAAL
ncbi:zinc finger and SCAN domain-containing protein 2-like [Sander lucioperca]|nr:zinc finger and SCAN domain-containing protein 2-like [Sander lucioperca]